MAITEERLRQTFSEGGAQEIYQEVKAMGNFLGFARQYAFSEAFRMCRFYPELMNELKRTLEAMEIDYYKPAVKCVRSRILSGRLK